MKELCLSCYNEMQYTKLKESQVILSAHGDEEICGRCGKKSRIVIRVPSSTPLGWLQCKYWWILDKMEG